MTEKNFTYSSFTFERLPGVTMTIPKEKTGKEFSSKAATHLNLVKRVIELEVIGNFAKTSEFLHFHNPSEKTIQGELQFPIPEGSTFQGYGLDIDGKVIDAVPVSKDAARVAFEDLHPKKGQVAIAEKVDEFSNVFKTRVYPMNPKQERVVKVVVFHNLVEDENNRLFWMSLHRPETLKSLELVYKGKGELMGKFSDGLKKVSVKEFNDYKKNDLDGFLIKLPKLEKKVFFESDQSCGDTLFCASVKDPVIEKNEDIEVKKMSIFFDCSTSREKQGNIKDEIEIVSSLFEKFKKPKIEIITFSFEVHEKKEFSKIEEVKKFLESIKFDGGTFLPLKEIEECNSDLILLLSDGLTTYGSNVENNLETFSQKNKKPLYSVSSSKKSSYILLNHLCNKTGGKYFNLHKTTDKKKVVDSIGKFNVSLQSINAKESDAKEFYWSSGDNGFTTIYGKIYSKKCKIVLDYGFEKKELEIIRSDVASGNSPLIAVLWANAKILKLSISSNKNKKIIEDIGLKYGIVSEQTSLIVLEKLKMYIMYKIPPPKSLKKMRKEYFNSVLKIEEEEIARVKKKLDVVSEKWKKRVDWHKRDFKAPEEILKKEEKQSELRISNDRVPERNLRRGDDINLENEPNRRRNTSICMENDMDDDYSSDCSICSCCDEPCEEDIDEAERENENENDEKSKIKVKEWKKELDYMKKITEAKDHYLQYLEEKKRHGETPGFLLDVADYFLVKLKDRKHGLRILSNIPELELGNPQLLRIIGYRLDQEECIDEAVWVFETILRLRPEEPQSYRDLALVYEKKGRYEESANLLYKVVTGKWKSRFDEIELTAILELNHVLFQIKNKELKERILSKIDKRFIYNMDVDLRVSMAWDTDMTDIDLHVYDTYGEHCFYSHKTTKGGGFISRDFTNGYGPEEYMQKKVHKSGQFLVTAKYFACHQQSLTGGTTILCTFFTDYLRKNEKRKLITLRLTTNKEEIEVCKIEFKV